MLLFGEDIEEMAHIVTGNEDGNLVTMYQVKVIHFHSIPNVALQVSIVVLK